jgi:hypothetical protein
MTRMKFYLAWILLMLSMTASGQDVTYRPLSGYVPDKQTAIQIARAVLVPIYGSKLVKSESPLSAKLEDQIWVITGRPPKEDIGGYVTIKISKQTGEILQVTHGK